MFKFLLKHKLINFFIFFPFLDEVLVNFDALGWYLILYLKLEYFFSNNI
jgi:hypothetical protein